MNRKTEYTDEPMEARVIRDFLPSPDQLVLKDEKIKVTISLSKKSVAFFKAEAKKNGTNYQKMIRNLLDMYATQYSSSHEE